MYLSDSNVKSVYVQTGWPETRYIFAKKISNVPSDPRYTEDLTVYEIQGREGLYQEATTLLSKYERRGTIDNLDKLCYAQFCKEYDPYRISTNKKHDEEDASSSSEEENDKIIHDQNMPFIQDVEEARERVSAINIEIVGEGLDPENAQDNEECNLLGGRTSS